MAASRLHQHRGGGGQRADAVLVLTEWQEYKNLDPVAFGRVVAKKRVLDGRNAVDRDKWTAAGWSYRALGRRTD